MAGAVYFIDGQLLEPTAFGRELTTGQWVPREVDFTPAQMRYSDYLTCPVDSSQGLAQKKLLTVKLLAQTTWLFSNIATDRVTFAPVPSIPFTSESVIIFCSQTRQYC